jgi:hypothetical protein
MALITCKNCGKQFNADVLRCIHCGTKKPPNILKILGIAIMATSAIYLLFLSANHPTHEAVQFSSNNEPGNIGSPDNAYSGNPALMKCQDVKYGSQNWSENMDKLAKLASLPNGYWNREHEDIIYDICEDRSNAKSGIDNKVEYGLVTESGAESIARVLGYKYKAPARTAKGVKYEKIFQALVAQEFCNACASNIASAVTELGDKDFNQIVTAALNGDSFAKKELEPLPEIYGHLLNLHFCENCALKWAVYYVKGSRIYINNLIDAALNGDMLALAKLRNIPEINDNVTIPEENIIDVSENIYLLPFTLLMHGNAINFSCIKNWHSCSDNEELVKWYREKLVLSCKNGAKRLAQYDEPNFSPKAFPKYIVGMDYVKSGYVTVLDDDVKFSNAFGTLVNAKIACTYDLSTSKVTDIQPLN